jgi:hypothetical protein
MQWIVYLAGAAMIAAGAWFILYTENSRDFMKGFLSATKSMFISLTAIAIGILLMVASFYSEMTGFVFFLGLLAAAKGCLFLVNPRDIYSKSIDWFLNGASDQTYRLFGIISLILGTAMISWA